MKMETFRKVANEHRMKEATAFEKIQMAKEAREFGAAVRGTKPNNSPF